MDALDLKIAGAVDVLLGDDLGAAVDVIAYRVDDNVRVASTAGSVTLGRDGSVIDAAGNPLADTDRYPNAAESIVQIFDADCAPDIVISHHPDHLKYDVGDHGSLREVHARAPFIAAGAGVRAEGRVDRSLRMVDVAPTIAAALGAELPDADGTPDGALLDGGEAATALVFLFDGANLEMLHRSIDAGAAPHLAALVERGTSYLGGALSSFPTVTLANHMTVLTGRHPGHTGVPGNSWYDRSAGEARDLLDPTAMPTACDHLLDGVETLHHAVHRVRPDAFTATTFEYCDAGADWSTFGQIRGGRSGLPVRSRDNDHLNPQHASIDWYRRMSQVDASSVHDAHAALDRASPDFLFVNFSLIDESGHHGGPFAPITGDAISETDARMGEILARVDAERGLDDALVVVLADHGMGECDRDNDVVISDYLAAQGIEATLTEETFVYLH